MPYVVISWEYGALLYYAVFISCEDGALLYYAVDMWFIMLRWCFIMWK